MKKTSRRSFGRQLTGAVAGISVSALTSDGQTNLQRPKNQRSSGQKKMFTHDTPPPTDFLDGSLTIGTYQKLTRETAIGARWLYDMGDNVYAAIAHIRVLGGNGEIIYQNLSADKSVVTIELEDTTTGRTFASLTVSVTKVNGNDVFGIDSSHKLPFQHPGQGSAHRPQKYSHPGPGGNHEFRISKITITTTTPPNQFVVTAPDAGLPDGLSQEYRVMIWHEGD